MQLDDEHFLVSPLYDHLSEVEEDDEMQYVMDMIAQSTDPYGDDWQRSTAWTSQVKYNFESLHRFNPSMWNSLYSE